MTKQKTKKTPKAKYYGLVCTLGGAANCRYLVTRMIPTGDKEKARAAAVPGVYHPERPTPVGGPGELTLELARELDADKSVNLKLVPVKESELDELRSEALTAIKAARHGAVLARQEVDTVEERDRIALGTDAVAR